MRIRSSDGPARRSAIALAVLLFMAACGDSGTAPGMLFDLPLGFSHDGFSLSDGIYRIPYGDGSDVTVTRDHHDHTPPDRIDMAGDTTGLPIVAAASGTIRAIVDRHGNSPGGGDGLSADGLQAQNDSLEHSCQDDETVVGSCSDYNNYVWIEHPNGEWTKYSHFGTGTVTDNEWEVGDWIEAGEALGLEGDVGAASGRHLHYEVGVPADPEDLTPFSELGGFMVPNFGVNLVPRTCDIPNLLYETGQEYTANPCDHLPPTADAGGPYEVPEGIPTPLDGSGSDDPEGLPLTFAWEPAEMFDDASSEMPAFLGVDDGEVAVTLTVYDQVEALWDTDETTVTILNVAPEVTINEAQVTETDEGETIEVLADFVDPGVLDAPFTAEVVCYDLEGFSMTVDGTVEIVSEDGAIEGTVTASCDYGDTSESGDPPSGTFLVSVSVTDKDGATGEASFDLSVANIAPTPVIDMSGAMMINGVPTVVSKIGVPEDFSADATDPGSDDLFLTWDWGDGSTSDAVYLLDDPNPDPFPSPTMDPRALTDMVTNTWTQACFYEIGLVASDDDGGMGDDSAAVVITGDTDEARGAGYWMTLYRENRFAIDHETLGCYLPLVRHMSAVFDEERTGTASFETATDVLWVNANRGDMLQIFERHLMTAWLNFANGAFDWDEMVDTDWDGEPDTEFGAAVMNAESVRLIPDVEKHVLEVQKDILESINESHGG